MTGLDDQPMTKSQWEECKNFCGKLQNFIGEDRKSIGEADGVEIQRDEELWCLYEGRRQKILDIRITESEMWQNIRIDVGGTEIAGGQWILSNGCPYSMFKEFADSLLVRKLVTSFRKFEMVDEDD